MTLTETISPELRQAMWDEEEEGYQLILRLENESVRAVCGIDQVIAGFTKWPTDIVCVDERVRVNDPRITEIALPGVGVLLTPAQRQAVADKIRQFGATIETIYYHDRCQAVAKYYQSQAQAGAEIDLDSAGRQAAFMLLTALGQSGQVLRIGYDRIADLPMTGHPHFHHARVILVDGTGRINPPALGLPTAFQYSARFAPDWDQANADLILIQEVALTHGFGEWFITTAPLVILLIGDPNPADWSWSASFLEVKLNRALTRYSLHTKVIKVSLPQNIF